MALSNDAISTRLDAIRALSAKKDVAGLVDLAAASSGAVRRRALDALAALGGAAAKALAGQARHADDDRRALGLQGLAVMGGGDSAAEIVAALASDSLLVRFEAALALAALAPEGTSKKGDPLVKAALAHVDDPSTGVRLGAVGCLERRDGADAATVGRHTSGRSVALRSAAMGALARVGAAVDGVIYQRADAEGSRSVRRKGASLPVPPGLAFERLRQGLQDECPLVRRAAIARLAQAELADVAAVRDMLERLLPTEPDPESRRAAIRVLGERFLAESRSTLQRTLVDLDPEVRADVARALGADGEAQRATLVGLDIEAERWDRVAAAGDSAVPMLVAIVEQATRTPLDTRVRLGAVGTLGRLKATSAVGALEVATRDGDGRVRSASLIALGETGGAIARAAAERALTDFDYDVRVAALHALGRTGSLSDGAATLAASALADTVAAVRVAAVRTLGQLGALELLFDQSASAEAELRLESVRWLGTLGQVAGIDAVVARLSDSLPAVQVAAHDAIRALGWLRVGLPGGRVGSGYSRWLGRREFVPDTDTRSAVEVLRDALSHERPRLRRAALEALAAERDVDSLAAVRGALGDADFDVRLTAAITAHALGDAPGNGPAWCAWLVHVGRFQDAATRGADAVDALTRAIDGASAYVAQQLAPALAATRSAAAVAGLATLARSELAPVRAAAIGALGSLGPDALASNDGAAALVSALDDAEPDLRAAAAKVLTQASAAPLLLDALFDGGQDGRTLAAELLGTLAVTSAASALAAALRCDPLASVRAAAATALGRIGAKEELSEVIGALGDDVRLVREAAREALAALKWKADPALLAAGEALAAEQWDTAIGCGPAARPLARAIAARTERDPRTSARRAAAVRVLSRVATGDEPRVVGDLIALIADPIQEVRWAAIDGLGLLAAEDAQIALAQALAHVDSEVTWRAARALGQSPSTAVELLGRTATSHRDPRARVEAVRALGRRATPAALATVVERLVDEDANVAAAAEAVLSAAGDLGLDALSGLPHTLELPLRRRVVTALAERHAADAQVRTRQANALVAWLTDGDATVRRRAASGLRPISGEALAEASVSAIARAVTDADPEVRALALEALRGRDGVSSVAIGALADPESAVRAAARSALAGAPVPDGFDKACAALRSGDAQPLSAFGAEGRDALAHALVTGRAPASVRAGWCRALAGDPREHIVSTLAQALQEPEPDLQRAASEALRGTSSPVARAALVALSRSRTPTSRLAALASLATDGGTDVSAELLALLDDPDPSVRRGAPAVLVDALGTRAVPSLVAHLTDRDGSVTSAVLTALGQLRDPHALPDVARLVDSPPPQGEAARAALTSLATIADPAVDALFDHESATVRRIVIGVAAPAPALAARLTAATTDPDPAVREAALRALARHGESTDPVLSAVTTSISDSVPVVRAAAIEALSRLGGPAAPSLAGALVDPDGDVRAMARQLVAHPRKDALLQAADAVALRADVASALDLGDPGAALIGHLLATRKALPEGVEHTLARLAGMGTEAAARAVASALGRPERALRTVAALALAEMSPAALGAVTERLLVACSDRQPEVRAAALSAFAVADPRRATAMVDAALRAPQVELRRVATKLAAQLNRGDAALVAALLHDLDGDVRLAALALAPRFAGDPAVAQAVAQLVSDPRAEIQSAAAGCLANGEAPPMSGSTLTRRLRLRALSGRPDALTAIAPFLTDTDASIRVDAVETLGASGLGDARPLIVPHLFDEAAEVRAAAAATLGRLGGEAPLELVGALADRDGTVRAAVLTALDSLGIALSDDDRATLDALSRRVALPSLASAAARAGVVAALYQRAGGGSHVRATYCGLLAGAADLRAQQALVLATEEPFVEVRAAACRALTHASARWAIPSLRQRQRDTSSDVRSAALDALGALATDAERDAFERGLSDGDAEVRAHAVAALGSSALFGVEDRLLVCLASQDPAQVAASALALAGRGATGISALRRACGDASSLVRAAAARALAPVDPDGVAPLHDDLESAVRIAALETLGQAPTRGTARIDALARRDPEPLVRAAAVDALVRLQGPEAAETVWWAAADIHIGVRLAAADAGRRLGLPDLERVADLARGRSWDRVVPHGLAVRPFLERLLLDADSGWFDGKARAEAVAPLERLGLEAAGILRRALTDRVALVRQSAARALGRLGAQEALSELRRLAQSSLGDDRAAAATALAALSDEGTLARLVADGDATVREAAVVGLSDAPRLEALVRADPAWPVQAAAALRLLALDDVARLVSLSASGEGPSRLASVRSLGCATPSQHREQRLSALITSVRDAYASVRQAAVEGLGRHGDAESHAVVVQALRVDTEPTVRRTAVGALSAPPLSAHPETPRELELALVDADGDVRRAARAALFALDSSPSAVAEAVASAVFLEHFSEIPALGAEAAPFLFRILGELELDALAISRRAAAARALGGLDADVVPALAQAALDVVGQVRAAAASALASTAGRRAESVGAVADLLTRLANDPDTAVRQAVAEGAPQLGPAVARRLLQQLASDRDADVRLAAATGLADRALDALDLLVPLLTDADAHVRATTATRVGEFGDVRGIDPLVDRLGDAVPTVRHAARLALGALHWTPVGIRHTPESPGFSRWTRRSEWLAEGVASDSETELLRASIASPDPDRRRTALEGLALVLPDAELGPVISALADPHPDVRRTVARALRARSVQPDSPILASLLLVESGSPERAATELGPSAVAALDAVRREREPLEREAAVRALGLIRGDAAAAEALRAATTDRAAAVRAAACTALGAVGPTVAPAEATLVAALETGLVDAEEPVRTAAARALVSFGAAGRACLRRGLAHSDAVVRVAAASALALVSGGEPEALPPLLALAETDHDEAARVAAVEALGAIGGDEGRAALARCLEPTVPAAVRREAVRQLGRRGESGALKLIAPLLFDEYATVRDAAVQAIESLGAAFESTDVAIAVAMAKEDWRALETLGEVAVPALRRVAGEVDLAKASVIRRAGAVATVGAIGGVTAEQVVAHALGDIAGPVRAEAARAAGRLRIPVLVPRLNALLDDAVDEVRREAASALGQIGGDVDVPRLERMAEQDADSGARQSAAEALAGQRLGRVDILARRLSHTDPAVRERSAVALGGTHHVDAIDPLIGALGDVVSTVRAAALRALEALGWVPVGARLVSSQATFGRWLRRAELISRHGEQPTQSDLLRAELSQPDAAARRSVLEAVARGRLLPLCDDAIAALDDPDRFVRREAAEALVALHRRPQDGPKAAACDVALGAMSSAAQRPEGVPPLARALREHEPLDRSEAARALGVALGSSADAIDALSQAVVDADATVRASVAGALSSAALRGAPSEVPSAVAALATLLRDSHAGVRLSAASALARLGRSGDATLVSAVSDADPGVRLAAAVGLEERGEPAHRDALLTQVAHEGDASVRAAFAGALGRTDLGASDVLRRLAVDDGDEHVRAAACRSLGALRDTGAQASLIEAVSDRFQLVRSAALLALAAIGWRPEGAHAEALVALAGERWKDLVAYGDVAVPLLLRVIREGGFDPESVGRRKSATEALTAIATPLAMAAVEEAARDGAGPVRAAAMRGIGNHPSLASTAVRPVLREALKDDRRPQVRVEAAVALGRVGDAEAVSLLIAAAKTDPVPNVRMAAGAALACPALRQIAYLATQLKEGSTDDRIAAARALGDCGDLEAVDALVAALADGNAGIRQAAGEALDRLGWTPLGERASSAAHAAQRTVSRAELATRHGSGKAPDAYLRAELASPDPARRRCATEAMGRARTSDFTSPLIERLDDVDFHVRREAAGALGARAVIPTAAAEQAAWLAAMGRYAEAARLGVTAAKPLARAVVQAPPAERVAAAAALVTLGPTPAGLEALQEATRDPDWDTRAAAAEALGALATGVDAIAPLLADPFASVRGAAAAALARCGDTGARALVTGLTSPSVEARQAAIRGLTATGQVAHVAAVAGVLHTDADPTVRIAAAQALGTLGTGDTRAIAALRQALRGDADFDVREAAATALGAANDSEPSALLEALADRATRVRDASLAALDVLGYRPDETLARAVLASAREDWLALARLGDTGLRFLERAVTEPGGDPSTVARRAAALTALADVQAPGATALLSGALSDTAGLTLRAAARALARHRGRVSAPTLARLRALLSTDPRAEVRVEAATALALLEDQDAVSALVAAAEHDAEPTVRLAAATALAHPSLRHTRFLIDQLRADDPMVRQSAAEALGPSEDPAAIDPLVAALGDAVATVRVAATRSLAALGWTPIGVRGTSSDVGFQRWLPRAELLARHPSVTPTSQEALLVAELGSADASARRGAVEALRARRAVVQADVMTPLLDDADRFVRRETAEALRDLGAVPTSASARAAAAVALGDFAAASALGQAALTALSRALREHTPAERVAAAAALPLVPAAMELLVAATTDAEASVRQAVFVAMGRHATAGEPAVSAAAAGLADADATVREAAATTLAQWGPKGAKALEHALGAADARVRAAAAFGLGAADADRAVRALAVRASTDDDARVRRAALEALGRHGASAAPAAETLAKALSEDPDPLARTAAAVALQRTSPETARAALIPALADPQAVVRDAVRQALAALGYTPEGPAAQAMLLVAADDWRGLAALGAAAVTPLVRVLTEPGSDGITVLRRSGAASALALVGTKEAVAALEPALSDGAAVVRAVATRGVGRHAEHAPTTCRPRLRALLESDPNASVRVGAAVALGQLGDAAAVALLHHAARNDKSPEVRFAAAEALASPKLRQLDYLVEQLRAPDIGARRDAARALGETGETAAIDPLIGALADSDALVRAAALAALTALAWAPLGERQQVDDAGYSRWVTRSELLSRHRLGAKASSEEVLDRELGSSEPHRRRSAVEAFAGLRSPSALDRLHAALDDAHPRVRREAAEALVASVRRPEEGRLGLLADVALGAMARALRHGSDAIAPLARALEQHPVDERRAAAVALASLVDSRASSAVAAGLADSDAQVRLACVESLLAHRAQAPAVAAQLADPDPQVRSAAARMLSVVEDGAPLLRTALVAPQPEARAAAAEGLTLRPDPEAVALLTELVEVDPEAAVRESAVRALGAADAVSARAALARTLSEDTSEEVRAAAASALARTGALVEVEAALLSGLTDPALEVREAVLSALEGLGWRPTGTVGHVMVALAREDWPALGALGASAIAALSRVLGEVGSDSSTVARRRGAALALSEIDAPEATRALEQALSDASAPVRAAATRGLGRHPDALSSAGAARLRELLLDDPKPDVRVGAATALGRAGDADAPAALRLAQANDESATVRYAASLALSSPRFGDIEPLCRELASPDAELRRAAAERLGETSRIEAIDPLIGVLPDSDARVRAAAMASLKRLGWVPIGVRTDPDGAGFARWVGRAELASGTDGSEDQVTLLSRALTGEDAALRLGAVEALADWPDATATAALLTRVDDHSRHVRVAAARALLARSAVPEEGPRAAWAMVALGEPARAIALAGTEALPALLATLLDEPSVTARTEVIAASAALALEATPVVLAALSDAAPEVRAAAARVSASAEPEVVVGPVIAALDDTDEGVRLSGARALVTLGSHGLPARLGGLRGGSAPARAAIAATMDPAALESVPELLALALDLLAHDPVSDVRAPLATSLASLAHLDPVQAQLIAASKDAWPSVRAAAIRSLGRAPHVEPVVAACVDGLADLAIVVRAAAREALSALGWKPAGPLAAAVAAVGRDDFLAAAARGDVALPLFDRVLLDRDRDSAERRLAAIGALVTVAPTAAVARLVTALRDAAPVVRGAAARHLGRLRAAESGSALLDSLRDDPSDAVRVDAACALGLVGHEPAVPELEALARHADNPLLRLAAATALAAPTLKRTEYLIEQLSSPDSTIREQAATALGDTEDVRAIDPLIGAMGDAFAAVRHAARGALVRLGWMPVGLRVDPEAAGLTRWLTRAELVLSAPGATEQRAALVGELDHADATRRYAALEGLAAIQDPAQAEAIAARLSDVNRHVRVRAAQTLQALGCLPDPARAPALAATAWCLLGEPERAVGLGAAGLGAIARVVGEHPPAERSAALQALASLEGDANALTAGLAIVVTALADADDAVRGVAVRTAAALGSRSLLAGPEA